MDKEFKGLDQSCPAFGEGCPYAQPHSSKDAEAREEATQKCPAFKDGCPFKNAQNSKNLADMLAAVPPSHKVGGQLLGSISALHSIMSSIHEQSKQTKNDLGSSDCPVFQTSCPFKNVTSSGTPLVAELEYRTWSVFDLVEEKEDEEEVSKTEAAAEAAAEAAEAEENFQAVLLPLSKNLKEGTRKSHRAAENVHFVKNFIKGKINKKIYKHMVASLWYVYTALEDELRKNKDHPIYSSLHFPAQLERQSSLEEDLKYYFGNDDIPSPSECTKSYVARIRQIGRDTPELLVAHAYTRYLGDLSGGRVLMRVAKKAMELPADGQGTSFYRFDMISSANSFKKKYRTLLDTTTVDKVTADKIVAEANVAFVMNMRVFEELDVMAGDADSVRSLEDVMATLKMPVSKEKKCPFAVLGGPNPHAAGGAMPLASSESGATDKTVMEKEKEATTTAAECPWPFILLHDPIKGVQNPLTFVLLAVCLSMYWKVILDYLGLGL